MISIVYQLEGVVEMADTLGPVYQITVNGTIFDQVFVNVWYYNVPAGTGLEADAVGSAFKIGILPNICSVQSVAVEYLDMQIIGARDSIDVATIEIRESVGLVAGDCLPPFAAWSFMYSRANLLMRNGYKRFPGVAETWQLNGEVVEGTPEDTLAGLGETLHSHLILAGDEEAIVVTPRRQWHNVALDPVEYWISADCNFHGITTQNSRKFGRS
jgi:hypothetical protein